MDWNEVVRSYDPEDEAGFDRLARWRRLELRHRFRDLDPTLRGVRTPEVVEREFWLADLMPEHDGVRVAHITDVHVGRATPAARVRAAVAIANRSGCELIVLTGDYLSHHPRGVSLAREQLSGLEGPVFAVLGNHDHWVDAPGATRSLTHHGYAVLSNRNSTFRLRGLPFTVVGVDDLVTGQADVAKAFRGAEEGSRLVLMHVPGTVELLEAQRASLCLAGHTHGGHVNIPGVTQRLMRRFNEYYMAGAFLVSETQLYVSRGLGGAVMPFRINARPEITILTLRSAHPDRRM